MKKIIKKRVSNNKEKIKTAKEETPELNQMPDIYRNIVEETSDSIYMVDRDCRYLYVNARYCSRLGLPLKDIIGKTYGNFHSSEDTTSFAADVAEVFQKGLSFQREYRSQRDGNEFLRTIYPIRQPADTGEITAVSVIAKDITQLRHVEQLYGTLAEKSPIGVFIVQDGNIQWSNKKLQESMGYKADELINMPYSHLVHPDDREILKSNSIAMLRGEISLPFEYRVVTKAGEILWHVGTVTSITHNGKRAILGSQMNIDPQKQAELNLRQSEERYRTIIDTIPDSYSEQDLKGTNIYFNDAYVNSMGYSPEELHNLNYREYMDKENAERTFRIYNTVFKTRKPVKNVEIERINKKGEKRLVEISVGLIRNIEGKPIGFHSVARDTTERRKKEDALMQSEERYRTIIDTIADAYYEVDLTGNTTIFNDAYLKLYEYSAKEMQGKNYRTYVDKEHAEIAYWVFHQVFKTGKPTKKMEWEIITKSGKKKQVELSVSLIHNAKGNPLGFRGIISDITERHKAEETIRHQAFHDPLTGLANRTLFYDRMHMAFNSAKRGGKMVAVIILDLDNFKGINDNKGHKVGDEVLKSISGRLSKMVRASDTVARYGGDEFTLIIPSLSSEENALIVAQKIVKAFNKPFHLDNGDITVTASIGVAIYPLHGWDIDTLMSKADNAMYRAKAMGRNRYCWYGDAEENS
ncbi:MAG: PAS domain S-box protein [Smithellaceae bacterium]|jgi:diguanylate cyclase (GGDEF)-like protein/PAS domain S-box-containing protein